MTNHTNSSPGDFRVCVFAAPGQVVAIDVISAKAAFELRDFTTVVNSLSREHTGSEFPSNAFIQRFNGEDWCEVPRVIGDCPWRVITVDGVYRFESEFAARFFAAPGEAVEHSPNMELARLG